MSEPTPTEGPPADPARPGGPPAYAATAPAPPRSPAPRHPGPLRAPVAGYPGQRFVAVPPGQGSGPGVAFPGHPPAPHGLASWGSRVGAALLDGVIAAVPYCSLLALATASTRTGRDASGAATVVPTATGHLFLALAVVLVTAYWVWNHGYLQGRTGASLGKRCLGLTLVDQHTLQPVGMGRSLLRALAHVLDSWSFVGYLWPLWDERRQTFADKIVGTVVTEG